MRAQLCPTFCDSVDCSLPGSSCPWDSSGKNTGVCCHFLLQKIFPTQRSNPGLLHCEADSLPLSHLGSPDSFIQFSSYAQSCLTLCNSMDCSTPASLSITNSWSLLKLMSIESVMPSNHLILFSSCLQSFPASGSSEMSQFFASGCESIGVSASASVLPVNIQDWSPLGWTGWISLLSQGLSRVFSNTTVQKQKFWRSAFFSCEIVISDFISLSSFINKFYIKNFPLSIIWPPTIQFLQER